MGMHNALMGTIDKCGYGVQQEGTIYDAFVNFREIVEMLLS